MLKWVDSVYIITLYYTLRDGYVCNWPTFEGIEGLAITANDTMLTYRYHIDNSMTQGLNELRQVWLYFMMET